MLTPPQSQCTYTQLQMESQLPIASLCLFEKGYEMAFRGWSKVQTASKRRVAKKKKNETKNEIIIINPCHSRFLYTVL